MDVREIDDRYPEYARPYEPTGQGRPHGALPWGLAAGFVLILLSALLSFTPAPSPAPSPPSPPATIRHTVTFVDWDGSVISSAKYDEGTAASAIAVPADPTRPSDGSFTYTFAGWSPGIRAVTGNITYTATYSSTPVPTRYTVTFENWDGTVLSRREYDEGTAASGIIRPATPTRPSDGSFTYTFAGWSPSIRAVTGNITYTAYYSSTPIAPQYTVTFVDWDSSVISSAKYDEGTAVSGITVPADPTRPSDGSFKFIFYGWTPDLAPVTADATYTAVYLAEELPRYDITFVDWDGGILQAAVSYAEGTPASDIAVPADPTRPETAEYTYAFAGWSPELAEVTADTIYTATYTETPKSYGAPTIDLVHELYYYDGMDDYFVDFTADVTLNDVAGATGQLKLRHFNAQTGAWEWAPLTTDSSEVLYNNAAFIQLFSVKGGVRTELTPSDYNALYDIPEDAEGLEAVISWRFPWYTDDEGYVLTKVREVMNLSFDYTLPDGTTGTVALSDDFYLYNDWFFGWIEEPQVDATEKTITFYYNYEVEYGGPLDYDNLFWHPHLYDHATGEELDMTPDIIRVVEDDGTVGDKIVYSFDTLVPGQQYDFTAEVIYSDYGVDDADYWDNWVSTHHTYNPVGFDVEDGKYTITWKDPDGLIIDTTLVDPGETPTHEDPTLWPTDQYTFTFTGWTPEIVPATENATYTAQCSKTLRQYPVVFVDEDGSTVLKEETWYDYGTAAADIVQPATPTKPSDATYDYTFAGWDPELEDVTWDATYTATYTATPRTTTAPTIDDITSVEYQYGSAGNRTDFQPVVTLNDVAGSTGRLKLLVEDPDNPGTWNVETLGDDEGANAAGFEYYDGSAWVTLATPGNLNAEYDIPSDAESLRADMSRYLVPPGGYGAMRVKAKVAFDYTLPDGGKGTVQSNEFFLYRGSFAERSGSPVLDRDARTITMDFSYRLVEGGEIDPAKVTWTEHHLYGKEKGDTSDDFGTEITGLTPEVTEYDEGGVHHVIVMYTLDSVDDDWKYSYKGTVYDDEWGDPSHWNNWETNAYQIDMEFELPPTISLVHHLDYWEDADEYFAGFASDITLNDVAGATGQVRLMLKNPETRAWEQVEFTDTVFQNATIELYTTQGGTSTELTPGSGPNAAYDIPEGAETLEAVISKHFELHDDEWNYQPRIREIVKIVFDYTLPDGTTGTVETEELYLYNDSFVVGSDSWVADTEAKTLTLTFPYQVDRGGPLDYDNIYWHPHLYWQPADDYHWGTGGTELDMTPEVSYYTESDGRVFGKIVYTFDTLVPNRIYEFEADVIYSDYGVDDAEHWDNWVVSPASTYQREMEFDIAAHEAPVIGIFLSAEYGGNSSDWHFGIGPVGCDEIPEDLRDGKARLKFERYDEDAGAWVDIEFISAADWEANEAKPWDDPTKEEIGDRQMFGSDTVYTYKEGDDSSVAVSTLADPTAMIELNGSDTIYASMMYHLPLNHTWEPASTLIRPVLDYEYPDGTTGTVEGNPIRVFSGSFVDENGAVTDADAKTITLDFIYDGGPYAIDPDNANWGHSLHWQDVSDGSYSSERYKDDPDDTHGWVAAEPTMETYAGTDGKTHVRITYTLDEISTDYAYDYLGTVYYFPELEGESGMWEAFPTQNYIRFN